MKILQKMTQVTFYFLSINFIVSAMFLIFNPEEVTSESDNQPDQFSLLALGISFGLLADKCKD